MNLKCRTLLESSMVRTSSVSEKKHLFLEFISEMFDSEEEDTDEGDTSESYSSDERTDEESDEDW